MHDNAHASTHHLVELRAERLSVVLASSPRLRMEGCVGTQTTAEQDENIITLFHAGSKKSISPAAPQVQDNFGDSEGLGLNGNLDVSLEVHAIFF
jgi:hypothetical protein